MIILSKKILNAQEKHPLRGRQVKSPLRKKGGRAVDGGKEREREIERFSKCPNILRNVIMGSP